MTKEDAIKTAWGPFYDEIKDRIIKEGWINYNFLDHDMQKRISTTIYLEIDSDEHDWTRPASLRGLEDNNGWFKFSEFGFPKENGEYRVLQERHWHPGKFDEFTVDFYSDPDRFMITDDYIEVVAYWRPIEKYKNPHY